MSKELNICIEGFKKFKEEQFKDRKDAKKVFGSQSPKVLVIACSDSRVDPAILFNTDPGDLFMIRNISNLVPPYKNDGSFHGVSAALEYAVRHLNVEHIIILGHSECGGIGALISEESLGTEFVEPWLNIAEPARLRVEIMEHEDAAAKQRACEREAMLVSMGNLMTFPWVKERVKTEELKLHAFYFNMARGTLEEWSPKNKAFVPLVG